MRLAKARWLWAALIWTLAGCTTEAPLPMPQAPPVTIAMPIEKDVVAHEDFTGTTQAVETVEIRARVKGYLIKIGFEPSTLVKEDQLLFEIDPSEYEVALERAKSRQLAAEANLKNAEVKLVRAENLLKTKSGTREDRDDALAERDMTRSAVEAAKADVRQAELDLGYTKIRAPIAGRAARSLVDVGNLVGAGENTLLTTIVTVDPMYAYFNVSERILLDIAEERREAVKDDKVPEPPVFLGLANETGYPHQGVIDYIDNRVDPATGTINVRGRFPNPESVLLPGLFCRLRVPTGPPTKQLLVAERAIGTDLGGKYLLCVDDKNVVEQIPIELGQAEGELRVVTNGLKNSERYIVNGLMRARPGIVVAPQMESASEPAPAPDAKPAAKN